MNTSEISLSADYSDDDYENIPLEEKKFWEYLTKLEENNLFKMNQLQEEQQKLEKQEKESQDKINTKQEEITDLDTNLEQLQASKATKKDSL